MLILAVDDEPSVAGLIQDILEREGHACLTASSVEDAEWILRSVSVDAMLLDLAMPGRRPLEWLEDLGRVDPIAASRTVVITGYEPEERTLRRIRSCGAAFLQKPFRIDDLIEAVRGRVRRANSPRGAAGPALRPRGSATRAQES